MSTMSSVSRKGLYGLILFLVPAIHCAQDSDWPEKDDFQQSYTLAPGSQVEVKAINGSVTIETKWLNSRSSCDPFWHANERILNTGKWWSNR